MSDSLSDIAPSGETRAALLQARDVQVSFQTDRGPVHAVRGVDFDLVPGEILSLVGESGSGKSVCCQALMGLLPGNADIQGNLQIDGRAIDLTDSNVMADLRGQTLSMIFQDPMSALDPLMTVRGHLVQRLARHRQDINDAEALLTRAGIADPGHVIDAYPHQLSGGLCQRVAIALALTGRPRILVADEPTTALDVTIQAQVLDLLAELRARDGLAVILISHDLGVVAEICDRIAVMNAGEIVETGPVNDVLMTPVHPYTKALLDARPRMDGPTRSPPAQVAPLLSVRDLSVTYRTPGRPPHRAVENVSFDVAPGETLGVVGESGSGKSTVAKRIIGLVDGAGEISLGGSKIDTPTGAEWRGLRRRIQYVFQDPLGALDPRMRVLAQVREPLDIHRIGNRADRTDKAQALLQEVGIGPDLQNQTPVELSGGQRQRVLLARALILEPELLLCDEPVSALDVSIQAQVLALLDRLTAARNLAMVFISHDLAVIRQVADRVAVLYQGRVVETGPVDRVFAAPEHPYTRSLLDAVPRIGRRRAAEAVPS